MILHHLSIADIRAGKADAIAITDHYLERIARFDGQLRAFTALDTANARAAAVDSARRIAAGQARPLEGAPMAIKANIDVKGLATTAGVAHRRNAIAAADAPVVTALRAAGTVILGHVNMHEAALGATTDNEAYGRTENPHAIGRTPGGSSGGSGAAVAAGLCVAALGTDTLGSVRIPAAYNGIYGLKPTNGLIYDRGLVYLARRLDSIGPLARSLDDLAAVFEVLRSSVPGSRASQAAPDDARDERMGNSDPLPLTRLATLATVDAYPETESAVRDGFVAALTALDALDLTVTQAATPDLDLTAARMGGFMESAREAAGYFAADRAAGGISRGFGAMLDFGMGANADAIAAGGAAMAQARATLLAVLETADAIIMPTTPQAAFAHGRAPVTQADFTALANIAGLPALALPAGFDADGLPVGIQLIGRGGDEARLLALGRQLDGALRAYRPPAGFA